MVAGRPLLILTLVAATGACSNSTPRAPEASAPSPTTSASASAAPALPPSSASATPDAGVPEPDAAVEAGPSATVIPQDMLGVPGGTFQMGYEGRGSQKDEWPVHAVTLKPFLLDKTEVTNEAYFKCVDAGVCRKHFPGSSEANKFGKDEKFRTPKRPISSISQADSAAYCKWVSKRLPTEAEWERAARGSDGRRYPWGNEQPTREHAVFASSITEDVGTHPKGAGPYGHQDLAGNVWEWLADMYDPYAYRRPGAAQGQVGTCDEIMATLKELKHANQEGFTGSNPIPDECEHGLRGGAFNYDAFGLRSSNRVHHPGRFRLIMSGFRCAKDWPDGPTEDRGTTPSPAMSSGPAAPPGSATQAPDAPEKRSTTRHSKGRRGRKTRR